jgi:hypothetical protein
MTEADRIWAAHTPEAAKLLKFYLIYLNGKNSTYNTALSPQKVQAFASIPVCEPYTPCRTDDKWFLIRTSWIGEKWIRLFRGVIGGTTAANHSCDWQKRRLVLRASGRFRKVDQSSQGKSPPGSPGISRTMRSSGRSRAMPALS